MLTMAAAAKMAKRACEGTIQAFALLPETLEERPRLCIGRKALKGDRIMADMNLFWLFDFNSDEEQNFDLYS